jgi:hypothetical protein
MLPDSLLVATSLDGGRSWHAGPGLAVNGLRTLEALIDDAGSLHVAGTTALRERTVMTADGGVFYATLRADGWTRSTGHIGQAASLPTLTLVSPDTLVLAWGVARPVKVEGFGPTEAPVATMSLLSPLCRGSRSGK